jgi:acyl-coenzyme A thioesterase PaaI-like protein
VTERLSTRIKRRAMRLMSFWPPYLGAGVRIKHIAPDYRRVVVEMPLRWWNANYVGTQFGGSLYAMVDPFFMLMLMQNLGRGYIVWDKAATIRFRRPGKGRVRAEFTITESDLEGIRRALETERKVEPVFHVKITDMAGETVAEVDKTVHVRLKNAPAAGPSPGSP